MRHLLASSNIHRDVLIRAMSTIMVKTTTTPDGLIHMMIVGKATSIVFSYDDLPLEGSNHTCPPQWLNPEHLPLATFISIGYAPSKFVPLLKRLENMIALRERILTSFNQLLGQPWIHKAGAISSILHQNVKFIHDGKVIMVHSIGDVFASLSPCFKSAITHSEGIVSGLSVVQEVELQHIVHKLQLSDGVPGISESALAILTSLDHMIWGKVDGVVPHDEYIDEILVMGMSQIDGIIWPELVSPVDLFEVSSIKVAEEI
ncbi:hypothetical protein AAG906_004800 [Vitis piasezkii]